MQPGARWGTGNQSFPQQQSSTFQARPPQQQQPFHAPAAGSYQQQSHFQQQQSGSSVGTYNIQPISSLSPFIGRWWIKARVMDKSPIRSWNKEKSQGKLFSMTLVDEMGDAIRATVFNAGVEKYYDLINNGQVFIFSKGTVKTANKKFSNLPCDYELTLDEKTDIIAAADDNTIIHKKYSFIPISSLDKKEKNTNVDLCAIVMSVSDVGSITTKAGEQMRKRSIQVADASGAQVELTLWEDKADQFNASVGTPILVKGARIGDFGGVSLSLSREGTVTYGEQDMSSMNEVQNLLRWYSESNGIPMTNMTQRGGGGGAGGGGPASPDERKPFSAIKTENLGTREDGKPDWFTVRATLTFVKQENMWYAACPGCNKKVTSVADGPAHCEKCQKDVEPAYRYIVSMTATDYTGNQWLTCFQDNAQTLFGIDAKQMSEGLQTNPTQIAAIIKSVCFKPYLIRVRAREEQVMDEKRLKCVVQTMTKLDYVKESTLLLKEIARYSSMPTISGSANMMM